MLVGDCVPRRCLSTSTATTAEEDSSTENVPHGAKRVFFDDKRTLFLGVTVCGGLNAAYWTAFAFLNHDIQRISVEAGHIAEVDPTWWLVGAVTSVGYFALARTYFSKAVRSVDLLAGGTHVR